MITPDEFVLRYPKLYHMAESGSWPSIRRHGLLSTSALLDLFEIRDERRATIESCHRPDSVQIKHPAYGEAVIRDQIPMREMTLKKCLRGCSPKEWYEFLNRRVFFWVTEQRVQTLLTARAYRDKEHLVITVDSVKLVQRHGSQIRLSPINSGSTIYKPVSRGLNLFRTFADYPYEERRRARGVAHAVAELAVDYSVPNIRDMVDRVERRRSDRVLEVIMSRNKH